MRAWVLFVLAVSSAPEGALAGANAGGHLLVHSIGADYSFDPTDYCGEPPPASCQTVATEVSAETTQVWLVLAVFSDANEPRLRGVEFGVSHSNVELVDQGHCADFEVPTVDWPQSGAGNIVVWFESQTERIVPVYWFAGHRALGEEPASLRVVPHPTNGGHFADDFVPPHLDGVAAYGSLGFGEPGDAPCPGARTFVLRPDGTGDSKSIQDAVFVAAPGSIIELEDGVYKGDGNRDIRLNDTPLVLRSRSGDPAACILDCDGDEGESHRAFLLLPGEDSRPSIEGITIRNGFAGGDFGFDAEGGALKMRIGSELEIRHCVFESCTALGAGGAIETAGSLLLEDCVFSGNACDAQLGGAIAAVGGHLSIRRCRFESNGRDGAGGAVGAAGARIDAGECAFLDNRASIGGGVYLSSGDATFERCTWAGNAAPRGGAVHASGGVARFDGCTLSDNSAQAGSGLHCGDETGSLSLERTILSYGMAGGAVVCGRMSLKARATDVFGNEGGDWPPCLLGESDANDNFSADPLYCDRGARDYRVDAASPCAPEADPLRGLVGAWPVGCLGAAEVSGPGAPDGFAPPTLDVSGASPNPFRTRTTIRFSTPAGPERRSGVTRVEIFDAGGRFVRSIEPTSTDASARRATWDGSDASGRPCPGGLYFVRVAVGSEVASARVLLLR